MISRRDILKQGILLTATGCASGALPDAVQRASAITPDPGTTFADAEHVVILMQENRSFDHMFGTLQGVRGFNDPRTLRQPDGSSVFLQRDAAGNGHLPWRLNIKDSRITWMGALPHGRWDQVDAWNGGNHNYWIEAKRSGRKEFAHIPMTMGYYTRNDIPFYYALADAFTVCDQHYCSIMTSTTPNRLMFWTGTVREEQEDRSLVYLENGLARPRGLNWKTYPERLEAAGISWKVYQNQIRCEGGVTGNAASWLINDGNNPLEYFDAYPVQFSADWRTFIHSWIDQTQATLAERESAFLQQLAQHAPGTEEALRIKGRLRAYAAQQERWERKRAAGNADLAKLTTAQKLLRGRAFATNRGDPDFMALETISMEIDGKSQTIQVPKGDILHQFREDVRSGQLPLVSWLVAPGNFSDHPSVPWYGAWYVSEVMNILTENPEVWKKTIFILTYDENDGYFDHAPSFVAADPKRPETGGASDGIDTASEYAYVEDELIQGIPEERARSGPSASDTAYQWLLLPPGAAAGGSIPRYATTHRSSVFWKI